MLGELYKYALDNSLVARPGFKQKAVKFYVCFSANGEYIGIENVEKDAEQPYCPDIGSLANGTTKSNIIAEKAEVIFNLPDKDGNCKRSQKQAFYFDSMQAAAEYDKRFMVAADGLKSNTEKILDDLKSKKFKNADFVSIKIDGLPLESSPDYLEWWESFRKSFDKKSDKAGKERCFITGELISPIKTVPPVQGLVSVGGHTKGDSLICFDKDAYQSYGLKQASNATVSEQAVSGLNSAVGTLLKNQKNIIAGAKYIHWYSKKVENDPLELLDFDFGFSLNPDEDDDSDDERKQDELRIKKLFKFISSKERPEMPENIYYMMSMSGVNGRVMIRSYDEGKYDELCRNIQMWYDDIGFEGEKYPKLLYVYFRLISLCESERLNVLSYKDKMDKVNKQLSGIAPRIIYAIMHGTTLPDTAASKAIAYIKSDIHASSGNENKKNINIDTVSCQFLKAWLNRKYRNENKEDFIIMDKLNENNPSKAYNTGRIMAVYAAIQRKALGDVGAGVIERYYTSACSAPALVIGKLATMSQYHLSKMEEKDNVFFSRILQEISGKIGCSFPNTFSLAEQSEFALGYYQQNAELYSKKNNKTEE